MQFLTHCGGMGTKTKQSAAQAEVLFVVVVVVQCLSGRFHFVVVASGLLGGGLVFPVGSSCFDSGEREGESNNGRTVSVDRFFFCSGSQIYSHCFLIGCWMDPTQKMSSKFSAKIFV